MGVYTATQDFSTTISVEARNTQITVAKGAELDLTDEEFAAVERDLPGALKAKAAAKAKKAPTAEDA